MHSYVSLYRALDWATIRVTPQGKAPVGKEWQTRIDEPEAFNPGENVGVRLGDASGGLVDVDLDCLEATLLAPRFLPPTATFGRPGRPQSHWLYRCPGLKTRKPPNTGLELRSTGGQTVFPPSIHETTGELISWDCDGAPAPQEIDESVILPAFGRLCAATIVARAWPKLTGSKHDAALAFAGSLWHAGWVLDDALALLLPAMGLDGSSEPHREQAIRDTWDEANDRQRKGLPAVAVLIGDAGAVAWQAAIKYVPTMERSSADSPLTDAGNTERFVEDHKDDIRYCPDFKKWMLWTGVRWELISTRPLEQAIRSARKLQTSSDPVVKKFGKNSESSRKLNSVIQDAANLPKIHVRLKELDADPWLLNTLSGVVDLRTGSVRPHRNSDFFTKITGVEYDPSAKAPRFEQFMLEVFDHDRELVAYVLRYLGQALTGLPSDRVMQFWYGPAGSNGKSTLINTLLWALGDYAQTMAAGLLLGNSRPLSSANARPDLVALLSARLVVGNETSEDHYFDESLVKQLTGRDRLSVRGNYQDQAQIHPTWTLALASNHKPIVRGGDTAIWDRLHLVPFNVRFTDDGEPRKDPELEGKLKAEAPGILALLVRSCMEWQAEGLRPPPRVLAAVEEYKKSQDTIGEFIEECCIVGDGLTTLRSALYEAFREWSERSGEKNPIGKKRFNQKMEPRFLSAGTGGKTHWIGLSCQHGTAVVRNAVEKGRDRGQRASLGRDPKDNSGSFAGADSTVRRKEIRRLD